MSFCVNIKKIYYHGVVNSYKNVFPIIYITRTMARQISDDRNIKTHCCQTAESQLSRWE